MGGNCWCLVSTKGRLSTNLGMENAEGIRFFLYSDSVPEICCFPVVASSNPLIGQISCGLWWARSRSELWNTALLCPQIRWIWLWMWTALVDYASLSWPDLIPVWPLCWKRTSTFRHPQFFWAQWTLTNTCADAAGVWRHVVPATHCWLLSLHVGGSPMSQPLLKQSL